MIYIKNIAFRTAKSANYLGNVGLRNVRDTNLFRPDPTRRGKPTRNPADGETARPSRSARCDEEDAVRAGAGGDGRGGAVGLGSGADRISLPTWLSSYLALSGCRRVSGSPGTCLPSCLAAWAPFNPGGVGAASPDGIAMCSGTAQASMFMPDCPVEMGASSLLGALSGALHPCFDCSLLGACVLVMRRARA